MDFSAKQVILGLIDEKLEKLEVTIREAAAERDVLQSAREEVQRGIVRTGTNDSGFTKANVKGSDSGSSSGPDIRPNIGDRREATLWALKEKLGGAAPLRAIADALQSVGWDVHRRNVAYELKRLHEDERVIPIRDKRDRQKNYWKIPGIDVDASDLFSNGDSEPED